MRRLGNSLSFSDPEEPVQKRAIPDSDEFAIGQHTNKSELQKIAGDTYALLLRSHNYPRAGSGIRHVRE
jgi:hypothetical protein